MKIKIDTCISVWVDVQHMENSLVHIYLFHLFCEDDLLSLFGPWASTWLKVWWITARLPLRLTWRERRTTVQKHVPKFWRRGIKTNKQVGNENNWMSAYDSIHHFINFKMLHKAFFFPLFHKGHIHGLHWPFDPFIVQLDLYLNKNHTKINSVYLLGDLLRQLVVIDCILGYQSKGGRLQFSWQTFYIFTGKNLGKYKHFFPSLYLTVL